MPEIKDPRFQSDFSSNKGKNHFENEQIKPGAKDSIGSEKNDLVPFSGSVKVSSMGPFGGDPTKK